MNLLYTLKFYWKWLELRYTIINYNSRQVYNKNKENNKNKYNKLINYIKFTL